MRNLSILIAEDMLHERLIIETKLKEIFDDVLELEFTSVETAEIAVNQVKVKSIDIAILDIDFSHSSKSKGMSGLEASLKIKNICPDIYTVVVSSNEEESVMLSAVEKHGVDWYLRRSNISFEELAWQCKQAFLAKLHKKSLLVEEKYRFLTESERCKKILRRVDAILPQQNTLIYGETGTGKELIARRIHANAKAFNKIRPLKILDCSSLSPQLFESEVFGHKKGSFTGAMSDKAGILQLVNGGDFFLDEIHNIPINLQQKLLRVLNDGIFSPIGSNEEIKSTFRVIAATNIPIDKAIADGKLLPDFKARIDKIRVELLPLRERQEDIPLLVKTYLERARHIDKEFTQEAFQHLKSLLWPGNIRELNSFVENAMNEIKIPLITAQNIKSITNFESNPSLNTKEGPAVINEIESFVEALLNQSVPIAKILNELEANFLAKAIKQTSIDELAKTNGYSKATLYRKIKEFGIKV